MIKSFAYSVEIVDYISGSFVIPDYIETPTIGEMLNEDYLIPINLSASKLAKEIQVHVSRINSILHGGRISADTAVRLAKYFGTSDSFFMNLQADIDVRKSRIAIAGELEKIPVAVSF